MLKKIRVAVAVAVMFLLTLYFVDFAGLLPGSAGWLAKVQFLPALLALSWITVVILIAVALLFGRVYCSTLCPLGIFQDVSAWLSKRFGKKKKRYKCSKPRTFLRWSLVAVLIVAAVCGLSIVQSLLDPYAAYGRMASNLFYPVYVLGNNLLEAIFSRFGNYTFYAMDPSVLSVFSLVIALLTFFVVGFMAWKWGRTYCNTVCPVGTILGFFSKYSLIRVRIDKDKCTSCGICSSKCKASCIDVKEKTVDNSRCVDCYNCLESCKFDALRYSAPQKAAGRDVPAAADGGSGDNGRREFIVTALAALVAGPKVLAQQKIYVLEGGIEYKREHPVLPPGAVSPEHLSAHCTACHLCIGKCPSRVLKPAFMEYGISGMMQPVMFYEKGFCNFDCTVCGDVCPNGAIHKLSVEEKHLTQMGRVVFLEENCVVHTDSTNCGACAEHCPTAAVTMIPYRDGLTIPKTDPDICIGCGGCEYICPVRPFRAIYVNGNPVQKHREEFHDEVQEVEIDGFGF